MKKIIVTLVAAIMATGAFAQIKVGVRAGGNLSTISGMVSGENNLDWGNLATANASQAMKLGVNLGAYAEYMVLPLVGIQVEANFSMQGVSTEASAGSNALSGSIESTTTHSVNYVNVPILAKVHFMSLRAYAGPQLGFSLGYNTTTETVIGDNTNTQKATLEDDNYNSFDLSFVVGAQYKLTNNIGIDARYNIGLTNVFPAIKDGNGEVLTEAWGKQGVLQLGVFYEF